MNIRSVLVGFLAFITISACIKQEPVSTTDPLPLPEEMAGNKDLSVDPGDSFYDYCNGNWLKNNPIPATGSSGGIYDQSGAMEQRV